MRLTVEFFDTSKCPKDIRVLAMMDDKTKYPVVAYFVMSGSKKSCQFIIELTIREMLDESGITGSLIRSASFSFTEEEILNAISQDSEELSGTVTIEMASSTVSMNCAVHLGKEYGYRVRVRAEMTELTLSPAKGAPLVLTQDRGGGRYMAEINDE